MTPTPTPTPTPSAAARRASGDDGAGAVAAIALIFAFTFLGLVWLARDVDRAISNRSAAQSIAFQAARSGAQAADLGELRAGAVTSIDPGAARAAAQRTAAALFASYGVAGRVTGIRIGPDRVTVEVAIDDAGRSVHGSGTVRVERSP